MDEATYLLRGSREHIWHLPSAPGKTAWVTLCTMPIRGREERLWPPDTPKPKDELCPKCQQIKRAQQRKQAKAEAERPNMETLYHSCGYAVLITSRHVNGREVVALFDSDPQWPGRKITECPGCDRTLHLANLIPEPEREDTAEE